jgi:malonyl-CoA O-methyltransferase
MAGVPAVKENQRLDRERIRRSFSAQAAGYDRYAAVQRRVADRLLQLFLEGGAAAGQALEVGAGTGRLSRRLARACPGVRPIVSDLAHGMTRLAAGAVPAALAVDADAQALPFRDRSLSLVLSSSVYQWLENLPLACAESARVLRPGGRFALALFGERTLHELRDSHRRAVAETGDRRPSHVQSFPTEAEVAHALMAAGFRRVRLVAVEEVEFHPQVADLLRDLKGIGARNAAVDRPPGLAARTVMARMADLYAAGHRRADGRLPATYHVIYALGRKPE